MKARILPAGDAALLVETDGVAEVVALSDALREAWVGSHHPSGGNGPADDDRTGVARRIVDLVPAATTVLILTAPGIDLVALGALVGRIAETLDPGDLDPGDLGPGDLGPGDLDAGDLDAGDAPAAEAQELRLDVRYDGPDLDEVAELTGLSRSEVITRHTATRWRAAFGGFAPGFAYLVGGDPVLEVPRRRTSRTTVPAGSVALAGGYSAVYPAESPGGWQLIGTTAARLWDVDRDPPALIRPGTVVRFVDLAGRQHGAGDLGASAAAGAGPAGTGSGQTNTESIAATTYFEVVRSGPGSLFQDAGRPGNAAIGVGMSGAADRSSYRAANCLAGNPAGTPAVECVLGGLAVRAGGDVVVAVTGARTPITVDGEAAELGMPLRLRAGQLLKLGAPGHGLRNYLAVRGGFEVPAVLGSCSTDTLSGVGPPPIARGDRIGVRPPLGSDADPARTTDMTARLGGSAAESEAETEPNRGILPSGSLTLRVTAGPRDDWFRSPPDLAVGDWVVSPHSNRVGLRLDRPADAPDGAAPPLQRIDSRELASEGVTLGAIQVPPSGQPVLFLADHPVTGGYPVIAVLVSADVDRAAQVRPGQRIRFEFAATDPDRLD